MSAAQDQNDLAGLRQFCNYNFKGCVGVAQGGAWFDVTDISDLHIGVPVKSFQELPANEVRCRGEGASHSNSPFFATTYDNKIRFSKVRKLIFKYSNLFSHLACPVT